VATVIETRKLSKFYGKHRGVVDLDLAVEKGETFGFLGPNGDGKTTTIRCLLGMLKATEGESYVLGEKVTLDGSALRRRIGYVPGEVFMYEKETGRWMLDYMSGFRGGKGAREAELIERLEFDPSRRIKELSKGNKQKLALIIGLMHDPELLIMDEPTSGLDPLNQEVVFDIIEERVQAGATLFLSSHILSEVERVCARVGIIREGRLVADENMRDLFAKRQRELSVTFSDVVDPSVFGGVKGVEDIIAVDSRTLTATVTGDAVDELIKHLATHRVSDVTIQHASLEDVFMEFYRDEPIETAAAALGGDAS
jgi:ABC-2 type transport system ATP-binding protein